MNVTEDGVPVFGQWNYRILCHPIRDIDLKLTDLKPVDNLPNRILTDSTFDEYITKRGARFTINPYDWDQEYEWDLLDEIMRQIPGRDNYPANITDEVYGLTKLDVADGEVLNTGYYHRWYMVQEKGALGETISRRGFADRNLFVAETTQERVAATSYQHCRFPNSPRRKTCRTMEKRFTYAVPLEVVWLTPLNAWNPFDIEYKGEYDSQLAKTVKAGGRNGGMTRQTAYDGIHSKAYYRTPANFFAGKEVDVDTADTSKGSVGVLDRSGTVRAVRSSGIRVFLPEILGLGELRTRYPVVPVHAEGSPIWKELEALRDVVMDMGKYSKFFQTAPPFAPADGSSAMTTLPPVVHTVLLTSLSNPEPAGEHQHTVSLDGMEFDRLTKRDRTLDLITSRENGHSHGITVDYDEEKGKFRIIKCDGRDRCFDGHSRILTPDV